MLRGTAILQDFVETNLGTLLTEFLVWVFRSMKEIWIQVPVSCLSEFFTGHECLGL